MAWLVLTKDYFIANFVVVRYSLRFGKRSRFGQGLSQTLGI
jgi:hypothetical protein